MTATSWPSRPAARPRPSRSRRPRPARSTGCSTGPASATAPGSSRSAPAGASSRSGPPSAARPSAASPSPPSSSTLARAADRRGRRGRPGHGRAAGLPRHRGAGGVRRRRLRRDDRGRRPPVLAGVLRHPRPAARARRQGRHPGDPDAARPDARHPRHATPGSTSTSSPAASCRRSQAIEQVTREHTTLRVTERLSFGSHYAETLRRWDDAFGAASAGPRARVRRDLRADVALLPGVLARRASRPATSTSSRSSWSDRRAPRPLLLAAASSASYRWRCCSARSRTWRRNSLVLLRVAGGHPAASLVLREVAVSRPARGRAGHRSRGGRRPARRPSRRAGRTGSAGSRRSSAGCGCSTQGC